MRIDSLRQRLRAAGAGPTHEQRVLRLWCQALPQDGGKRQPATFLPASLLAELPAIEKELQGLVRQLGSAEIVAQVVLARRRRPVKKVVFMGMGEPAHNLANVMEAIELLGTAGNIGHKNLVFSTVGDERVFERLPQGAVKPALALSLHSTRADLREELLPRAPKITPDDLVEAGHAYARATGYPMQVQWTLMEGVNDTAEEVEGLVRLLKGRYAVLNMIPYNSVPDLPYRRPAKEKAVALARELQAK